MFGVNDLNSADPTKVNHYYWVLPSTLQPELTGPQSNPITAFQARVWDCTPPPYAVGWVTTFIPRSSADQTNLNNRCLAYIRVDFEGRVQAYRVGACNPTFSSGSFDYFSHLNFNGFSYTYGVKNANTQDNIIEVQVDISAIPVYNPYFYTSKLVDLIDESIGGVHTSQI